jgi:hypothetical protein
MNERFKELAVQAGFQYNRYEGIGWAGASLPKFAELIVRECIAQCNDGDSRWFIAQHFGVEE